MRYRAVSSLLLPPGYPGVAYQKRVVTRGVLWVMSDEDDTRIVTIPGAYVFEVSEDKDQPRSSEAGVLRAENPNPRKRGERGDQFT
jgi:hypothetical protein